MTIGEFLSGESALAGSALVNTPGISTHAFAQLVDRLVAVVANEPIFLSDVREVVRLRLLAAGDEAEALDRLIDRRLVLAEVARYSQAPPAAAAVDRAVRDWAAKFPAPPAHDAAFVRAFLADTLRIEAYVDQRFSAQATSETSLRDWLRGLRDRAQVRIIR